MVMSAVLGHELSEYVLQDLRVERHGCEHIKADEYREPGEECWQCKAEAGEAEDEVDDAC